MHNKTVSLVLGSGGAKGLAHIGVIKWLEDNDYQIKSISGSSIGALIGGVYAAGRLADFEQWLCALTKLDIISLLDISWGKGGIIKGDKIINSLVDLVGEQCIEDLPLTYTAVASDIHSGKEVWLRSGKLFDAIRASISIPLIFTPFSYKGGELIDGGVLNPVPIAPAFGDDTDLVLAVNLGGALIPEVAETTDDIQYGGDLSPFKAKISRFINSFQKTDKNPLNDWGAYDVAIQAIDAMQSALARHKLAVYPPDCLIEIPRNACGTMEFNRAEEMIKLGYEKTGLSMKELEM